MVKFTQTVDFSGFQPLPSTFTSGVWGAAVGSETLVIGWYRDAISEPPNWTLHPVIYGQTVILTVPGTAAEWTVLFYDTKTGTDLVGTAKATRKGNTISVTLPDFTDDIAFKMYPA